MSHCYQGHCECGDVRLTLELPETLDCYSPRQCDCDFCMQRDIRYLSHPDAVLSITAAKPLDRPQQGSMQAEFLTCTSCHSVIAASCQFEGKMKGAVNAQLLVDKAQLQAPTVASPKLLEPEAKAARWQQLWAQIKLNESGSR